MSRGPVVYSPPPGTEPQSPGDVIQSAVWNAFVQDVTLTFNTIQPIEYGGTNASTVADARTNLQILSYGTQTLTDAERSQAIANLGGGWEVVPNGKKTVTAVSSVAFTGLSAYSTLKVTLFLLPGTTQNIDLQVSANDGSSYYTLITDYSSSVMFSINGTGPFAGTGSVIGAGIASNATAAALVLGSCIIGAWKTPVKSSILSDFVFSQSSGLGIQKGHTQHTTAGALNAFRIIASTGTFTGDILVEGIK